MKPLKPQPSLTEQVYHRLLDEMSEGRLGPGQHLVQEQLAAQLGVSRQPVQQALALLKSEGLVLELGKRGLFVSPLEPESVQHRYEIRASLDGLAARKAALRVRAKDLTGKEIAHAGEAVLAAGEAAVAKTGIAAMVQCDIRFHEWVYEVSGNPLIAQTAAPHWRHMRRVMGEVLRHAEPPKAIWRQHRGIVEAIAAGDARRAEALAVAHVWTAAERLERTLAAASSEGDASSGRTAKPNARHTS
jgi:DNA-binding GntR family transcriptional regulator